MSKLHDTLDSILRRYYHANTPAGEKEACLTVFKRKCASNSIDADKYQKEFEDREVNKKKQNTTSSNGGFNGGFNNWSDFEDIFRDFARGYNTGSWGKNARYEEPKGPQPGSYAYESQSNFVKHHGEIKDCIYTVNKDNIVIQALYKVGERWAIENFVFYCGGEPKKVVNELKKYDMFKFTSNGKRYAQNLNITRIWGLDLNMKEHPIY